MKILILGTCTSSKANVKVPTPASEVYQGVQHQYILEGYNMLKEALKGGSNKVDYYIISAKYGLINSSEKIKPYDRTFCGKTEDKIEKMSQKLEIDKDVSKLIPKYDIVFWTLSDAYMKTIPETLAGISNLGDTTNIFFIPESFLDDYPTIEDEDYIILKDKDTKKYGAGKVMLKGKYFLILCKILCNEVNAEKTLKDIKKYPEYIKELVNKYYKKYKVNEGLGERLYDILWWKI